MDTPLETPTDAATGADDGFLTKEQLQDRARFTFEERSLDIPELGGKVQLRALSVGERNSLTNNLPNDPKKWELKHTAMSLAVYVKQPQMPIDDWTETIKPWPAQALDRINREITDIINISSEEEASAGMEFPPEDD
jgi:hypothetical protein